MNLGQSNFFGTIFKRTIALRLRKTKKIDKQLSFF